MRTLLRAMLVMSFVAVLLELGRPAAHAQCSSQERQKITASDGVEGDEYGFSVSISGDTAIVGSLGDDDNGDLSGSAYISRWNGVIWMEEQKLLPLDGFSADLFGVSVSISGDAAIVGAYLDDDNGLSSGSAYVYRRNGVIWMEEQKLLASDGAVNDRFGTVVSISGDTAIVGASLDDDNGLDSGSAYVYRWNGLLWVEEQKLLASDRAAGDLFGSSVFINGNTAIVGAQGDDDNGDSSGSAYIYRWNGVSWLEEQKLVASDGALLDRFGVSVCIRADRAIVGSSFDDDNGSNSGAAFIYRWNGATWVEEQKLLASDGFAQDSFGISVCISDTTAIVGAHLDDDNGSDSGSAYIYRWTGVAWVEEQKLVASDGGAVDQFGLSVSISGDTAILGASLDDDNGANSGSAYMFSGVSQPGCPSGRVNLGVGAVTDVLLVNGTSGDLHRTVRVGVGASIGFSLAAAPAGPDPGTYILWVWPGTPSNCSNFVVAGQTIGCTINPTPLNPLQIPQPIHCLVGVGIPGSACGGARVRQGTPMVPWTVNHRGVSQPAVFTIQGVIQDNGAANTRRGSVTNAITLRVE